MLEGELPQPLVTATPTTTATNEPRKALLTRMDSFTLIGIAVPERHGAPEEFQVHRVLTPTFLYRYGFSSLRFNVRFFEATPHPPGGAS
jgi:hypothetical protein